MSSCTSWWVYVVACDSRLYTGITTDVARRLRQHRSGGSSAARFTRGARVIELRYSASVGTRSLALRAEHRIKRLPRRDKLALIRSAPAADQLLQHLGLRPTET
ncbi:MAG: GIY-YIG nuclease family protein [Spirochaetaceae bacterium]|nr:MAG: GIY-YIG nuclease family protein [Spirochaetaceae bacterium]